MKIHLVDDWRRAWTWFSVWFITLAGAVQSAALLYPDALNEWLPPWLKAGAAVLIFLGLALAGRVVKQGEAPK